MCKLFNQHKEEIRLYCEQNGLNFDIAQALPQCWGKNDIWLQYHDQEKGREGLRDETPAPIVLIIHIENEGVRIEKTEFTDRYLKKAPA